jgi:hypothetical protein
MRITGLHVRSFLLGGCLALALGVLPVTRYEARIADAQRVSATEFLVLHAMLDAVANSASTGPTRTQSIASWARDICVTPDTR